MIVEVDGLLSAETTSSFLGRLEGARWVDGRQTNPGASLDFKHNLELERGSPLHQALASEVEVILRANQDFTSAVLPKHITEVTLSRYAVGMHYAGHLDSTMMGIAGGLRRSDMSFTIFLSGPDEYDGGELVLESGYGTAEYKGERGSIITYPSTLWHEVRPVTRGVRTVVVGWLESYVRDLAQRQLLADLKRCPLTQDSPELKTIYFNLLRMWADT